MYIFFIFYFKFIGGRTIVFINGTRTKVNNNNTNNKKVNASYESKKKVYKLNHLLFMDDLKLFSNSEEQMDTLVRPAHVSSTDIGMEFGMKNCGILIMKRGEIVRCEGIKLLNCKLIKEVEKAGRTYLGLVELDKIKENEMKEKTIKEYKRRLRLVLK